MKKYKKIAYLFLIIIICVLSLIVYTNAESKEENKDEESKTYAEIMYIESRIVDILNSMNNIETRNYNISVEEINNKSDEGNNSGNSGVVAGGSDSNNTDTNISSQDNNQDSEKYEMKEKNVLTNSSDINWNYIKSEVEKIYLSIPTLTLDLYQLDVEKNDILSFNKEFDNLTKTVAEENKIEALKEMSLVYDYFPKFLKKLKDKDLEKKILEAKSYIFKGYSKLDNDKWNEISNDIKTSIDYFSKLLTDVNIDSNKQNTINKVYVMINELQNAVEMKDIKIFLIKYKNIVEEIDNL